MRNDEKVYLEQRRRGVGQEFRRLGYLLLGGTEPNSGENNEWIRIVGESALMTAGELLLACGGR